MLLACAITVITSVSYSYVFSSEKHCWQKGTNWASGKAPSVSGTCWTAGGTEAEGNIQSCINGNGQCEVMTCRSGQSNCYVMPVTPGGPPD